MTFYCFLLFYYFLLFFIGIVKVSGLDSALARAGVWVRGRGLPSSVVGPLLAIVHRQPRRAWSRISIRPY